MLWDREVPEQGAMLEIVTRLSRIHVLVKDLSRSGRAEMSFVALFVPDEPRYLSTPKNKAGPGLRHGTYGLKRDLVQFRTQMLEKS